MDSPPQYIYNLRYDPVKPHGSLPSTILLFRFILALIETAVATRFLTANDRIQSIWNSVSLPFQFLSRSESMFPLPADPSISFLRFSPRPNRHGKDRSMDSNYADEIYISLSLSKRHGTKRPMNLRLSPFNNIHVCGPLEILGNDFLTSLIEVAKETSQKRCLYIHELRVGL